MMKQQSDSQSKLMLLTFRLRGVDISVILESFNNGNYQQLNIPKTPVKMITSTIEISPERGKTSEDPTYEINNFRNNKKLIVTTNCRSFTVVKASIEKEMDEKRTGLVKTDGSLPYNIGSPCDWCNIPLTHPPVGIPIRCDIILEKYIFHVTGEYCTFGCAFADLKVTVDRSVIFQDPNYANSEMLLKMLFNFVYPDEKLISSPPRKLLIRNNGSLTQEEYFLKYRIYKPISVIIMVPAKIKYLVEKIATGERMRELLL